VSAGPDADPKTSLSRVITARMTDDGGHFVVLEGFAPFLKVFRRNGSLRAAFLRSGDGPGEMRTPTALAVSGDTAILVLGGNGRTAVYSLDGALLHEVPALGFPGLAAAGCGPDWIVYGPRFQQGGRSAQWLHRVRFRADGALSVTSAFPDTAVTSRLAGGLAYGGVSTPEPGVLFRHTLGRKPGVLAWPCGNPEPHLLPASGPGPEGSSAAAPGAVVMSADPGARALAGLAAVAGGYATADLIFGNGTGNDRTEFILVRGGRSSSVQVQGSYMLWDGKPGVGILAGTRYPVPRVFLLSEADFVSLF
jgi:hypothetical protein